MSIITTQTDRPKLFERGLSHLMLVCEDIIKVPMFKCQRCGECILSHTALICSQRCPKRIRNGPCGGTREGGYCEVYPERRCVWYLIGKRSRLFKRRVLLEPVESIHNWRLEKTSAWLNVFTGRIRPPVFLIRKGQRNDS